MSKSFLEGFFMGKAVQRFSVIQKEIPGYLAKPIGHIITRWAFFEYHLSRIIWELLDLDEKPARVAVAAPRAQEKLDNIRDLLFLKKIVIDEKVYTKLRSRIVEIGGLRDNLCHGVWKHDEKGWAIISFKGYVNDQSIERLERSRKFRPERFGVTVSGLAPILEAIDALILALQDLRARVSSPEKLPKRPDPRGDRRKRDTREKP
jgi:hypothetical protein